MHIPAECFQKRYCPSNCLRHCKLSIFIRFYKNICKIWLIFFSQKGTNSCLWICLLFLKGFLSIYGHFYVFLFLYFFVFFSNVFAHFFSVSLAYVLPDMSSLLPFCSTTCFSSLFHNFFFTFLSPLIAFSYSSSLIYFLTLLSNSCLALLTLLTSFQIIKS